MTKTLLVFVGFSVLVLWIQIVSGFGPPSGLQKTSKTSADLIAFREALSTYEVQTGFLPTTEQGLKALWQEPTTPPVPTEWHRIMSGELYDQWGNPYQYRNPGLHNPKSYDIFSMGPDGIAGTGDDIGNWLRVTNGGRT